MICKQLIHRVDKPDLTVCMFISIALFAVGLVGCPDPQQYLEFSQDDVTVKRLRLTSPDGSIDLTLRGHSSIGFADTTRSGLLYEVALGIKFELKDRSTGLDFSCDSMSVACSNCVFYLVESGVALSSGHNPAKGQYVYYSLYQCKMDSTEIESMKDERGRIPLVVKFPRLMEDSLGNAWPGSIKASGSIR